jgi:carbonic anhydrase/acetyltransferase-like protein (isoleucine patch superfamily)
MPIYALGEQVPEIHPSAYIHPDAVVIGSVTIGADASVWPCAVLRGDRGQIRVGAETSIQDGAVVHCNSSHDTIIGARCVIGHAAHLEGCTVYDDTLIGSGAIVLSGVEVGPVALVGAGAMVPPNRRVPAHARALGVPAIVHEDCVRPEDIAPMVNIYRDNAHWYAAELRRLD